jgi:hypothetical protein
MSLSSSLEISVHESVSKVVSIIILIHFQDREFINCYFHSIPQGYISRSQTGLIYKRVWEDQLRKETLMSHATVQSATPWILTSVTNWRDIQQTITSDRLLLRRDKVTCN